jgi:DNA-binding transcriptional LysR family regulator
VQLILTSQALDPALTSADLAIRICDKPPAGYLCQALMTVRHIACASAGYLQAHGTPTHPRDLKHHQCIRLGETPDDARWQFQRQTQTTTVQVSGRYQVNQAEMRLEAVMQHLGIACLPEYTLKPALADGRVVQVLPEWSFRSTYSGTAYAVYPDQRQIPSRLSVFLDYLAAEIYP